MQERSLLLFHCASTVRAKVAHTRCVALDSSSRPRLPSGFRAAGGGTHAWDSTVFPLRGYRGHHSPGTGWGSPAAPAVESAGYTKGTLVKHFSVVPDETKLERWSLRPQCRDSPRPVLVRGPTAPWGGRDAQSPEGAPGAKPDRPG